MPVYPSGGTIAQSVGSPGFGPAPAPVFNASASVRFNPADSANISFTPTLQGNRSVWTMAFWFKRSSLSSRQLVVSNLNSLATIGFGIELNASDQLEIYDLSAASTFVTRLVTTQVFRDPSQWYHLTFTYDTTQSTSSNRLKLYINGVQVTAFGTATYPAQFYQGYWNQAGVFSVIGKAGAYTSGTTFFYGGYLADMNLVDGLALTPSSFTATDANTGQLVPAQYAGNRGTNGFYLPFSSAALAVDLGQNPKTTAQDFPYWPYNTLLVDTTSTNGAQNNTFLDSSTNNFTVTRNGNTTQGNFTPFTFGGGTTQANGYYSGYFDGNGDYLSNTTANVQLTGNFTVEMYLYPTTVSAGNSFLYAIGAEVGSRFAFYIKNGVPYLNINAAAETPLGSTAVVANQWQHLAFVRVSTTITAYINGVSVGSTSAYTGTLGNSTQFYIGSDSGNISRYTGFISNFRAVNGTAVYTANFTVPTTPLTAVTNTQLLTCQSSQFIDNSTNAFAITANGNAQPLPTNPFGMTAWSGYFDGTGDYLNCSPTAFGTGNFTIECYVYFSGTSVASEGVFHVATASVLPSAVQGVAVASGASGGWALYYNNGSQNTNTSLTAVLNTWIHIAVVRNSGTIYLYINGILNQSQADTANYTNTNAAIGGFYSTGFLMQGNISNFRIVNSALYSGTSTSTSNFTPPTAPLTAISGTSLLTCQSSTFIDNSPNAFPITVNGNSYTGTLNNPFGNPINYTTPPVQAWSTYFDGSGDYISSPSGTPVYNLGTGLWTWEAWINTNSTATIQTVWFYYTTNVDAISITVNGSTGVVSYNVRATNRTDTTANSPSGSIRLNQWHHIAMVRDSGTNITCYIDGKAVGVIALASNASFQDPTMFTGNPTIGAKTNTVTNYFSGYISNVRFVRGSVVYTGNFTPPTAPLTAVPGTMTLACQSNRVRDNSIVNAAQVANGNTSISPVSPFIPTQAWSAASYGGTMYFDGTGDYLTVANNAAFDLGSGNATIETWIYPTTSGQTCGIFDKRSVGVNYSQFPQVALVSGAFVAYVSYTGSSWAGTINGATPVVNTWTHVAFVRNGNTWTLYVNGAVSGTPFTAAGSVYASTDSLIIGASTTGGLNPFNGYISNARILKGTALYTTPFVPPVLPPTAIANTSLLLNATNAGIYDSTGQNVLETVGNAQVTTAVKKFGESSISFDGSGDYVVQPTSSSYGYGTGDFTIEFWLYLNATSSQTIVSNLSSASSTNPHIFINGTIRYFTASADRITGASLNITTWYHIAVCRVSGSTRLFINGTQSGSTYADANNYGTTAPLGIGTYWAGGSPFPTQTLSGYLQDLRITRGVGRYSGNFTPPAAAFAYNQYDIGNQQWLPTNISVTAGVNQDNLVDSPSDYGTDTGLGGQVRGNYATLNPLDNGGLALSNGNLDANRNSTSWLAVRATIQGITSGKWYWECTTPTSISGTNYPMVGVAWNSQSLATFVGADAFGYGCSFFSGQKFNNNVNTNYGTAFATNDIMGVAFDADNGKIWFSKNGTWFASGDPVAGTNAAFTGITGQIYAPTFSVYGSNSTVVVNFGQRAFSYTAPAGFKCLVSTNLPTPTIGATSSTQASDYFDVSLWTGADTGTTRSISGLQFAPDLWWSKIRSDVYSHQLYDSVRGGGSVKSLSSNDTAAEGAGNSATYGYLSSFDPTGVTFTRGSAGSGANPDGYAYYDQLSSTYVAWAWRANGTGVANTAGTIPSTVSANTTSGCSVVTWTGNGTNGATIGHGLGVAPVFTIIKSRSGINNWYVWHQNLSGNNYGLSLNATDAQAIFLFGNLGTKTSTTLQLVTGSSGADNVNLNGRTYVGYFFAPISGFSAMGSYTGNGLADGPMIYTGFRPAYVLIKRSSAVESWCLMDSKREGYNVDNDPLFPNLVNAEGTQDFLDLLSNGFKLRSTDTGVNGSGTYIYIAFAESPFKYSRAR